MVGLLLVVLVLATPASTASRPALVMGVLLADPRHLAADAEAGVRLAVLELRWDSWQPRPGNVDSGYRSERRRTADAYRAAGYRVAVDVGLQHPPDWVLQLPSGQLRAQDGRLSGSANLFFSRHVQAAAATYMADAVQAMGEVWSYRAGLSQEGEALYPRTPQGEWWAFDEAAQGQALQDLPAGRGATPLPGWVPGTALWRGREVRPEEVEAWYDWYVTASIAAHTWQVQAYRDAGFSGVVALVLPGVGVRPRELQARLADRLAVPTDDVYQTLNRAAVWYRLLADLPDRGTLAVDVSSVYDGSGSPRGNSCHSDDDAVDYLTEDVIGTWSSTRWLSYLARRLGYRTVIGESTGDNSAADLAAAVRLSQQCRLTALQWAWDYQLHDGVHASVADLARHYRDTA